MHAQFIEAIKIFSIWMNCLLSLIRIISLSFFPRFIQCRVPELLFEQLNRNNFPFVCYSLSLRSHCFHRNFCSHSGNCFYRDEQIIIKCIQISLCILTPHLHRIALQNADDYEIRRDFLKLNLFLWFSSFVLILKIIFPSIFSRSMPLWLRLSKLLPIRCKHENNIK